MQTPDTQPSLERIFEVFTGYQRTGAVKAAMELDLFTHVGRGADTAAALAEHSGASERGLRILCDFLVSARMLAKRDGRYALTPDTAMFFDRRSAAFVGSAIEFVASPLMMRAFGDVAGAVRRGGTVLSDDGALAPEHPMWVEFARAMAPLSGFEATLLANVVAGDAAPTGTILDIAAGHGLYGITLAKQYPGVRVVALDWPNVLAVAAENANAAGVTDRFATIAGSALSADFGSNYDIVLLTNFLHHFDRAACATVLRKVHAALAPGGRAVVLEFVPNDDRVSPPAPAAFALVMLVQTPGGDAYTFAEYDEMLRRAGFARSRLYPLEPSVESAVIAYKD